MTDDGPAAPHRPRRQARGERRRAELVRAAADIILRDGPAALSHRAVAAEAGVPLASTTYYFDGLDEIVADAGALLSADWAAGATRQLGVAREAVGRGEVGDTSAGRRRSAEILVDATLPVGDRTAVRGFYEQLVGAGRSVALESAYARGRVALDAALVELTAVLGVAPAAPLLVAVIDGAAVTALAEGRDVRAFAIELVEQVLASGGGAAAAT
ncbi:TetR/AcrR family transcriptional regulator [Cellulomonas sp. PhB143]|uniref:TetR/AcrR family transcriptional regulator n=1 Tax=Cellulomonas sp. PhB143 TaxID=2485186 RepID=UPI000F4683EF|nr:TetR family transcriptional regulator [Cellulomonas sp. PhB143]ROS76699.1 TetR family transcriptional regulator [Cellulomonas sp. PhB143]